jgi:hypothetical protein
MVTLTPPKGLEIETSRAKASAPDQSPGTTPKFARLVLGQMSPSLGVRYPWADDGYNYCA